MWCLARPSKSAYRDGHVTVCPTVLCSGRAAPGRAHHVGLSARRFCLRGVGRQEQHSPGPGCGDGRTHVFRLGAICLRQPVGCRGQHPFYCDGRGHCQLALSAPVSGAGTVAESCPAFPTLFAGLGAHGRNLCRPRDGLSAGMERLPGHPLCVQPQCAIGLGLWIGPGGLLRRLGAGRETPRAGLRPHGHVPGPARAAVRQPTTRVCGPGDGGPFRGPAQHGAGSMEYRRGYRAWGQPRGVPRALGHARGTIKIPSRPYRQKRRAGPGDGSCLRRPCQVQGLRYASWAVCW